MKKAKKILSYFHTQKIIWRTTFWVWGLISITIIIFIVYTIPFQTESLISRMENESADIASSILHANQSALITEDYGSVVDHCLQLVSGSKSILYIVITRKDGYSLVHTGDKWLETKYSGFWLPDSGEARGKRIFSTLVNREVFHHSLKVSFSGVDWGWIHIGLSLDDYKLRLKSIRNDTIALTAVMLFLGLIISFIFAKKLTRPIRILDDTTKRITGGDLEAQAIVNTGDELQSLAVSFNKMTEALRTAKEDLEDRVQERTSALANINKVLLQEISERKKIEKSLQTSIGEKNVLIQEIHHRVKNNLQIISSLLFLQSSNISDEETLNIFRDSQARIKSMALVHEKLYQSKELSKINFSEYLHNLSSYVYQTYRNTDKYFRFIFDLDEIFLSIDTAIPLGLILNELLTNAFKYAFTDHSKNLDNDRIITIFSKNLDGSLVFSVADNGVGLPGDLNIADNESLGLKLVQNLTEQLKGELKIESDPGTKFTITLKNNFEEKLPSES